MTYLTRSVRCLLFVTAVTMFLTVDDVTLAAGEGVPLCEEVCTESTQCNEECYENMMEWGNGNAIDCLEWDVYDDDQFCCGDAICEAEEGNNENEYCEYDCGSYPGTGIVECPYNETECNPTAQTGCGSGNFCTNEGCCVTEEGQGSPPEPPPACFVVFCQKSSDCCPGEMCVKQSTWQQGACYPGA